MVWRQTHCGDQRRRGTSDQEMKRRETGRNECEQRDISCLWARWGNEMGNG